MKNLSEALALLGNDRLTDDQIVERVLAGDAALFELLIRRHGQRVYRTARAIVGNESDAEETLQETYLRAFQHLSQFEYRANFSTWLLKIAIHAAIARRRCNARFEDLEIAESKLPRSNPRRNPEQLAVQGEAREVVQRAIYELPPMLRNVVILREIQGMSTAEAAEALEISQNNLKVRLHRAKAALREKLVALSQQREPRAATVFLPVPSNNSNRQSRQGGRLRPNDPSRVSIRCDFSLFGFANLE